MSVKDNVIKRLIVLCKNRYISLNKLFNLSDATFIVQSIKLEEKWENNFKKAL